MEDKVLDSLKLRIKNINEDVLNDLIADAITDVKTYINWPAETEETFPEGCNTIIKDIVMIRANRLGSEGIASESHSGVSQTYENDFPPELKRRLNKYRRLP